MLLSLAKTKILTCHTTNISVGYLQLLDLLYRLFGSSLCWALCAVLMINTKAKKYPLNKMRTIRFLLHQVIRSGCNKLLVKLATSTKTMPILALLLREVTFAKLHISFVTAL